MSPTYQTPAGHWTHVLVESDEVFETEADAYEDYKRCLAQRSCSTGGCDD